MLYNSVESLIGSTPMVKIFKNEDEILANVYAKLEFFNPAGSVKDRAAKAMIDDFEQRGLLNKDTVIIEPTSGNTGIGLALIGALRGYKVVIVMPDTMSVERIKLMEAYGATVELSDGKYGMKGAIELAEKIHVNTEGSIIAGQFVNSANPAAHYNTTGPEIYEDTNGKVDILVAGVGTGGTLSGTGKFLKEKNPDIKVVAVEPKSSAVLSGGEAGAHAIQGIGAGFVTDITDTQIIDEVIAVANEDAYEYTRLAAQKEGLLVGISAGAALCAAAEIAKREENRGKNVVVILADTGSRYLSGDVFGRK